MAIASLVNMSGPSDISPSSGILPSVVCGLFSSTLSTLPSPRELTPNAPTNDGGVLNITLSSSHQHVAKAPSNDSETRIVQDGGNFIIIELEGREDAEVSVASNKGSDDDLKNGQSQGVFEFEPQNRDESTSSTDTKAALILSTGTIDLKSSRTTGQDLAIRSDETDTILVQPCLDHTFTSMEVGKRKSRKKRRLRY